MLRGVNELHSLFGEDSCYFGVEVATVIERLIANTLRDTRGRRGVRRCWRNLRWRRSRVQILDYFRLRTRGESLLQHGLGLVDPLLQLPMRYEIASRLIEMGRDGFHREHAIRQQRQILLRQAQTAVEHAPQPVIQGLGESDAVPRLRHLRATGKRMTRAIDVFRDDVRLGNRCFAFEVCAHRRDVCAGLTRIDLPEDLVRRRLLGSRCFSESRCVSFDFRKLRFRGRLMR